jgi:signal transduction histidine kinase
MLTATAVLGGLLARAHETSVEPLRRLAARALLEDAGRPLSNTGALASELLWWSVTPNGQARPRGAHAASIDAVSLELAAQAREQGRPLLRTGAAWDPVRFAAPREGRVLVAWLPPAAAGSWLLALVIADVAIFTAFGATLLRGRLVRPLQRLEAAARSIADGDLGARAPTEGPRETFEVASAFNEMTEALETRTRDLEKAVVDLRERNRQLREARAGLDRAERLAAVGCLAAGVAHEVGNPMGALLAFVDLARRDAGLSEASRGHLQRALDEGERVRRILRQILDFSRPPHAERAEVDLVAVAHETVALVRAQRRYAGIEIEVAAQGTPPAAWADRNQVVQILLNLLLNAADAVLATPQPRVRLWVRGSVRAIRAGEDREAARARRTFDSVECRIEDNGPGIADEDRGRVFDPFFSTKEPGQGTGLGLSNALRFAEELGGSLTLEPGPGAAFCLRLPAAGAEGRGVGIRAPGALQSRIP